MTYVKAPGCFAVGATLQPMQYFDWVAVDPVVKYLHCAFFSHKAAHSVGVLLGALNNRFLLFSGHL